MSDFLKTNNLQTFHFEDEPATYEFAREFSAGLNGGDIVLLEGDLGAGKTALARAMIRHLAGDENLAVPSPTFTLVQTYVFPVLEVWHFDLYRLTSADEIFEIGWEEAMAGPLTLVEWPGRLGPYYPEDAYRLTLKKGETGINSRILTLETPSGGT